HHLEVYLRNGVEDAAGGGEPVEDLLGTFARRPGPVSQEHQPALRDLVVETGHGAGGLHMADYRHGTRAGNRPNPAVRLVLGGLAAALPLRRGGAQARRPGRDPGTT